MQEAQHHDESEETGCATHELRSPRKSVGFARRQDAPDERGGRMVELRLEALPLLLAGRKAMLECDRANYREVRVARLEVHESEEDAQRNPDDQRRADDCGRRRRPTMRSGVYGR